MISLRKDLSHRLKAMPDLGFYPESWQIDNALTDSAGFAKEHKHDISQLIDIADLQLQEFAAVKQQLKEALQSSKQWQRYWALISLSHFNH
ncbi:hypothetical protein RS130_18645 [Paraglaciecola aquimarina]|uniref:Uncharacterized protein n=1 Tax=Paraglaciecola aquimarina TaxID=1235557 RepID=A0ABU3T046_9ALTE|nr:hypothetical protein [Paraglaciecola aquimarina]MDU0355642.1 hypothetical protein [Paraglaciecola aquimarina]